MKKIQIQFKFIFYIFLFISISNVVYPKIFDNEYNSAKTYNYFVGILSLKDNNYASSNNYFKQIEGLEDKHSSYAKLYQYSMVNSGKIGDAYRYSKKIRRKKKESFEGNLIIGVYYLKNKKYEKALKYFQKLKNNNQQNETLEGLISHSLVNWVKFLSINKDEAVILNENITSEFKNIKRIQNTLIHCFFRSDIATKSFQKLIYDKEVDFSRYSFFYANYLEKIGNREKAIAITNQSLQLNPRNLLLNQLKNDLNDLKNTNFINEFDCTNVSNISAEIFYIVANALSSQQAYTQSNFYLNLAKYLNPNFISFEALYAENFYMSNKFEIAKKIYKTIIESGPVYGWHASKRISSILEEQGKQKESIEFLKESYEKISSTSINKIYDYARFLNNNEDFYESIKYYTKVLNLIDEKHYLYPKTTDGRGRAYERTDQWEKAEKDFLNSLRISPDQAYVINYLAYSWIEKGINIEKSLKMLKTANNLEKNDGYILDSLGWALFKLKRYDEAEKYLRLAMILMPSDPVVNDHYGDVLWMREEKIQARYYWHYVSSSEEAEEKLRKSSKEKAIFGLKPKINIKKS